MSPLLGAPLYCTCSRRWDNVPTRYCASITRVIRWLQDRKPGSSLDDKCRVFQRDGGLSLFDEHPANESDGFLLPSNPSAA